MFTGRDDEIKEITNLITDESTRVLNIWGSPGFGKTSTTVEVAHHLNMSAVGYRVYFFKLQYVNTVHRFLSKILSIFQSKVDPTITHLDKIVSIFREISCPVILMFDNLDDLLTRETSSTELVHLFDELLDSSASIKILFTTRELLKTTRGQVQGFRDIRIRPLSSTSSVTFVRQLLPSFSENIVAKVVRISFLVPLAMKILASSLAANSEDIASEMLDEFNFSENLLEQIDIHAYEEKMQNIFESLFKRLKLNEKQALIYLTAFGSALISKDAAIEIICEEMGSKSKAVLSLNTLVKKTFIDKDVNTEYYSVHPLIYSFVRDKAKQRDFENVLNSSRIRFCRYYLLLFERLNDDFLAGKSVDSPKLQDAIQHLSTAMFQSTTIDSEIFNDLFRILSKSEIFLFLIRLPHSASYEIHKLYDLAIEKSKTLNSDSAFLKLHVSKYFQSIAFSIFVKKVHVDIAKSARENIDLLSDGTPAKLSCYEAIFDICYGHMNNGIRRIEMCLGCLQKCTDHLLLKCLCLQILVAYYSCLNQVEKSCKFREMAFDVCAEIGNFNLYLIGDCDGKNDDVGESLFLFHYLFAKWSKRFLPAEINRYVCNFVYELQQPKEVEGCNSPDYFSQIICYADYLVASLGVSEGQEVILDEKIEFLNQSVTGFQDSIDATDKVFSSVSQKNVSMAAYSAERLLFCYDLKIAFTDKKEVNIEACRSALDHSLRHYGEQHQWTAKCYYNVGSAEYNLENYNSALSAFNEALKIMLNVCHRSDLQFINNVYHGKGKTYERLGEYGQAYSCFEEALNLQKTNNNEESQEFAAILSSIGSLQFWHSDLTSALATFEHALRIRVNLFREKRCSYRTLVLNYRCLGNLYENLGNDCESKKCFENALEILKTSTDGEYESKEYLMEKCAVYLEILQVKVDENLCMELLDRCLPVVRENAKWLLPELYLTVGVNQLKTGKKEDGLAFIENVLDLDLDDVQRAHAEVREMAITSHIESVVTLIDTGKYKLAKKIIERALQIAETLPVAKKSRIILKCNFLRGRIQMNEQKYASAIKSLQQAHRQHSKVPREHFKKLMEFSIRWNIATAHYCQRTYKDALNELLSIIKDCLVEGSENEAETYRFVAKIAQKMKIKSLVVRNLQLAYNTCSKVLGEDHPKTRQCHTEFVRASMHYC